MHTALRLAVIGLVLFGMSAPLIAWWLSYAAARTSLPTLTRQIIGRSFKACVALLATGLICSLVLAIIVPGGLSYWCILTFITLGASLLYTGINLYDLGKMITKLSPPVQNAEGNVHPIDGNGRRDTAS